MKEYFPISVFCFLSLIFQTWSVLLKQEGLHNLSRIALQARSGQLGYPVTLVIETSSKFKPCCSLSIICFIQWTELKMCHVSLMYIWILAYWTLLTWLYLFIKLVKQYIIVHNCGCVIEGYCYHWGLVLYVFAELITYLPDFFLSGWNLLVVHNLQSLTRCSVL